jgi:Ca2+-binding EF-hand superfamily protein
MWTMTVRAGLAAGLGLLTSVGNLFAQDEPSKPIPPPAPVVSAPARPAGDIPGPIDHVRDLQETGKMLFKLVDLSNDGLISQKEAVDAANLLVGGFFFRADANGDGTLAPEEMRAAREEFLQYKPVLRALLHAAHNQPVREGDPRSKPGPISLLAALLDDNSDKQLQASEVRKAVQTVIASLYDMGDTNHDGQMSPVEVNAALITAAHSVSKNLLQAADVDRNGMLSEAELDRALQGPLHVIFHAIDTNGDGQISPDEARKAQLTITSQLQKLRVPKPPSSTHSLLRSGQPPETSAPVSSASAATSGTAARPPAR